MAREMSVLIGMTPWQMANPTTLNYQVFIRMIFGESVVDGTGQLPLVQLILEDYGSCPTGFPIPVE